MIPAVLIWLSVHGSLSLSENRERLDQNGKPETIVWVKFTGITF